MIWAKTALAVTFLVSLWVLCPSAWANGGTPQLTRAPAGPYVVSVWTRPVPPRPGYLHVSVAVIQPSTGEPVLNATVRLTVALSDQSRAPLVVHATRNHGHNKLLYDTTLTLPTAGGWRFIVHVHGPAGEGSTAFTLTVVASSFSSWGRMGFAGVAASLTLMWLIWCHRR